VINFRDTNTCSKLRVLPRDVGRNAADWGDFMRDLTLISVVYMLRTAIEKVESCFMSEKIAE
jgi:hypothetical protein